ncbi:MAG TPA: type I methionyl aminopeptidase [Clostridia bacterium]
MKSIKSKTEIDLMRKSGEILALTLEKIKAAVKPGITTGEIDRIAEEFIRQNGAIPSFKGYPCPIHGGVDYPGSVCASVNEEVVHGIPGLKALKDGDIISIDVGVFLNGYHADAARTYPVGNVSEDALKLIKVTEESFYKGISYAVVGNRIVDISAAIQNCVEENGFSVVRDYIGHGIGKELHEPPSIPNYVTKVKGWRLEPGMTFAIEPMVNQGAYDVKTLKNKWTVVTVDGSLSAHYENTIAVTDNEPLVLTRLD